MSLRFGIDVGGTFTDVVCINDGALFRGKADTTHYDLKVGFSTRRAPRPTRRACGSRRR
jgi:N-methylhydantoinase A/oxoprolinase/acetone carboxylase beta subunit